MSCPRMVRVVGAHRWGGQDTVCSPFHKLVDESCLAPSTVAICCHSASATSLGSAEEQCKTGTFTEGELLGWRKSVCACGFLTLEPANLLDHSTASGGRGQQVTRNTFAEIAHFPTTLSPTSHAAVCHNALLFRFLAKDEDFEI